MAEDFRACGISHSSSNGIDQFVPKSKDDFDTFMKRLSQKIARYSKSEHYHDFLSNLFSELCGKLDSEHIKRYEKELSALGAEKLKEEKKRDKQKHLKAEKEPTLITIDDDVVDDSQGDNDKLPDVSVVDEKFEDSIGAYSPLLSAWDSVLHLKPKSSKVDSPKIPSISTKEIKPKEQLIKPAPSVIDKLETVSHPKNPLPRKSSPAPGPSGIEASRTAKRPASPRKQKPDLRNWLVITPRTPEKKKKKTAIIPNPLISPNDSIFNESYDILKRPEKPIGEVVVRKKDERRKLQGHDCPCCEKYFDGLDLSPESRAKRVNDISRHRKTYRPYKRVKTPEHFWEMDFPDTPELIRRGYLKQNF